MKVLKERAKAQGLLFETLPTSQFKMAKALQTTDKIAGYSAVKPLLYDQTSPYVFLR